MEVKIFCRSCGKELSTEAEICMSCGVRPPGGDKFCPSCGTAVIPAAELCVKCGARLMKAGRKSKTTAVLLAVFLSYWTWLYTYKKSTWKFWLNLGLSIVTLGVWWIVAWIWAIIDTVRRPSKWYESY